MNLCSAIACVIEWWRENETDGKEKVKPGIMSSFNYIKEACAIRDALVGNNLSDWRTRISDAIDTGSTSSEILMTVR